MAQSIKMNDDLYWDTSGLYGGNIYQPIGNGSLTAGNSVTVTVPNLFRGLIHVCRSSASGLYSVACTSSGVVHVNALVESSAVTITAGTNQLTITCNNGSTYPFYIGRSRLEVVS